MKEHFSTPFILNGIISLEFSSFQKNFKTTVYKHTIPDQNEHYGAGMVLKGWVTKQMCNKKKKENNNIHTLFYNHSVAHYTTTN